MPNIKINQALVVSYSNKMKKRIEESTFFYSKRTEELLMRGGGFPSVYAKAMIKNLKEHKENDLADLLKDIVKSYK